MKIVLFTVAAGGGHSNAAEAVKKNILLKDPKSEVYIIDILKAINPLLDKVVIGSYIKTLKLSPILYGKLYNYTESDDGFTSTVSSKLNHFFAFKIKELLDDLKPDIVICTHPFPGEMVSYLKKSKVITMPFVIIMTDYSTHGLWIQDCVDKYIVSNEDMIHEMTERGVDKDIIYPFGIPVLPSFLKKYNKSTTLEEIGFDKTVKTILVMGGSLGMGKISKLFKQLLSSSIGIQIIVITGNNKKLYTELSEIKIDSNKKTHIIGFTKEVSKYMQACDLLITKPGGLTITEALIHHVPLGIFSPLPGHEVKNAKFLLKNSLAISLDEENFLTCDIEALFSSPVFLETMKNNCKIFSKPDSGEKIYELLVELTNNK